MSEEIKAKAEVESKVGLVCKHGRLARSCEVCGLEQELKDRSRLLLDYSVELDDCRKLLKRLQETNDQLILSIGEQVAESIRMGWL